MALEHRVFEVLLEKSGRLGALPEVGEPYTEFLGTRDCTLDCPREEILVSPSPSFIFVMNEELLGVYPTPTGVYIRKPLERGEEVMVLQPAFKDMSVHYYNVEKRQLYILCEGNRKLIQYNLADGLAGNGVSSEVLGLPRGSTSSKSPLDMKLTDEFVFILFSSGHLFCIDRSDIRETAQAKLVYNSENGTRRMLLSVPNDPEAIKVVMLGYNRNSVHTLKLKRRKCPLYFDYAVDDFNLVLVNNGRAADIILVIDVDGLFYGVVSRRPGEINCCLTLYSRSLRPMGKALSLTTSDYIKVQGMQIVLGPGDLIYLRREDNTLAECYIPDDFDPDAAETAESRLDRIEFSTGCRVATCYVYR
ncbi:hypothetical protein FOL47_009593 [Perkinsus chesapeaki]|uniref:Uncharacterized protein n=1 Tax=Perkinsus chesapeaki TaxID=330153 RepID=A0A7J6MSA0_PERCH|nr:hypothetical protein FOL47_009593 [Perkinsus chesapeaki]